FSIVWGCLATIFACTWVSVHPNVPPPNQSSLQLFWRRLKMMLIGIIAPEIIVGFAARQFFGSRQLKKSGFSRTHGMFFCMGGFVSPDGRPIVTMRQLEDPDLGSELQDAIQNVKKEDIKDKSKGDALSKGVALLQGLWFILQCLARAHQRLAITQLEVATLAFSVVNVFIWLLWWNKPLDVQQPIVVGSRTLPDSDSQATTVSTLWWENSGIDTRPSSILLFLVGTVFGAVHCAAWNAAFPTLTEMSIWRTSSLVIVAFPPLLIALVPIFSETAVGVIGGTLAILIYIPARIILIVLPLAELRSLPASAFVDVNWSTYIPHI
ncbi:hypothetical protein C8R45DRAFT_145147, partial [Mycena sanguinolenta]